MVSKMNKSAPCPYNTVHSLAQPYAYQCSNQCEHVYSKSGDVKHVDSRIYIVEFMVDVSKEQNLKQLDIGKNDKG